METNGRGNQIVRGPEADAILGVPFDYMDYSRYVYDSALCGAGWKQFDTDQDAWYFGFWVDLKGLRTFTFAEGDRTLVICPDREHLKAELDDAEQFYGAPPPAFTGIDFDKRQITEYYDERPKIEL